MSIWTLFGRPLNSKVSVTKEGSTFVPDAKEYERRNTSLLVAVTPKNKPTAISAIISHNQVRHADPMRPASGDGWFANTPSVRGTRSVSWNAPQIRAGV